MQRGEDAALLERLAAGADAPLFPRLLPKGKQVAAVIVPALVLAALAATGQRLAAMRRHHSMQR